MDADEWSWCSIFTVTTVWNTGETGDIYGVIGCNIHAEKGTWDK